MTSSLPVLIVELWETKMALEEITNATCSNGLLRINISEPAIGPPRILRSLFIVMPMPGKRYWTLLAGTPHDPGMAEIDCHWEVKVVNQLSLPYDDSKEKDKSVYKSRPGKGRRTYNLWSVTVCVIKTKMQRISSPSDSIWKDQESKPPLNQYQWITLVWDLTQMAMTKSMIRAATQRHCSDSCGFRNKLPNWRRNWGYWELRLVADDHNLWWEHKERPRSTRTSKTG